MAGGNGPEGFVVLTDHVESSPQPVIVQVTGPGRIHGEIAGVVNTAILHLPEIELPSPLQNDERNLAVFIANICTQPRGDGWGLICRGSCI